MKENTIRELYAQLLSKAFKLGSYQYVPGEGDLAQAMMGALYEVMHWLHKEHEIYLLVGPVNRKGDGAKRYSIHIVQCDKDVGCTDVGYAFDDEYFTDWVEAHVKGLEQCLKIVEEKKIQQK